MNKIIEQIKQMVSDLESFVKQTKEIEQTLSDLESRIRSREKAFNVCPSSLADSRSIQREPASSIKFRVRRTSDWYGEEKPCEKAEIDAIEEENDDWKKVKYYVEIQTINDLFNIIEETGHGIIISRACQNSDNLPEIEIYDEYRE